MNTQNPTRTPHDSAVQTDAFGYARPRDTAAGRLKLKLIGKYGIARVLKHAHQIEPAIAARLSRKTA